MALISALNSRSASPTPTSSSLAAASVCIISISNCRKSYTAAPLRPASRRNSSDASSECPPVRAPAPNEYADTVAALESKLSSIGVGNSTCAAEVAGGGSKGTIRSNSDFFFFFLLLLRPLCRPLLPPRVALPLRAGDRPRSAVCLRIFGVESRF